MRNSRIALSLLAAFVWVAVGCSNPAADAPQAEVSEPTVETPAPNDHTGEPADAPMEDSYAEGTQYAVGSDSTIGFVGSKVTGSHEGGFKEFAGQVTVVDGDPSHSKVEFSIDATSLYADNEKLTGHLKSPDFFNVEAHPHANFESTSIATTDDGYSVTGNLTLHGVTKQIVFPAAISVTDEVVTADAEFSIQRFDFNIEYKGMADDLIRDDVLIKLHLVAKPEPTPVS